MNLILFKKDESLGLLKYDDPRAIHIRTILKSGIGDTLDIGVIGKKKGKMTITSINSKGIRFTYNLIHASPNLLPVTLIIGTPRPPVAKRLLKDLSTIGISRIIMCATDLGEKSYLTSKLWKEERYQKYIIDGGVQGESTILPEVNRFFSLKKAIESINKDSNLLALDNISPDFDISSFSANYDHTVIAIGGERGFSDRERLMLKEYNFKIFRMGNRVLRTETACHLVLGSVLNNLGLI